MSKFGQMAGSAKAAHAHYFADTVTVAEAGSDARDVEAVVGKVRTETRTDEQGRQQRVSVRQLRFVTLESIRHDARITIDGEAWSIDEVLKRTASGLYVRLQRIQTHQINRTNYRGKP